MVVQLVEQLRHRFFNTRFHGGIDTAVGRLDAATTRQQCAVFQQPPVLLMAFAQGLGQLDPAINELRDTLAELRSLTRRLQDDPARFLLGRDQRQEFQP